MKSSYTYRYISYFPSYINVLIFFYSEDKLKRKRQVRELKKKRFGNGVDLLASMENENESLSMILYKFLSKYVSFDNL